MMGLALGLDLLLKSFLEETTTGAFILAAMVGGT
jgi:hypothetical protein